ncbi:MAG: asparaginase [Lachnospiraceae bacterium]|nr:asparaginase [Lachnospiraceae bacterium]
MNDRKHILIINTGGTIGMTKSEEGYKPDAENFSRLLHRMDALMALEMPLWDITRTEEILDSSNMTVEDWNDIGRRIADVYDDYDGFVILHGTDTMAYTASALSFMLEGLSKPVIITGSQIPLCEIRSDGRDNIIASLLIASSGRVNEVCIYFGNRLLRGNRAIKYSADGLIAFVSPNFPTLAEAGITISYNDVYLRNRHEGEFRYVPFKNIPIGVIKVFPGIQFELFEAIMTEQLKGVVLETFGAGNIPQQGGGKLLPIIEKAYSNGTVLTVCSQCPQGTVSLGTYETSSALKKVGAVSGKDMTTEAAVAKLYYLFSKGYDKEKIKTLMGQDMRGEMS